MVELLLNYYVRPRSPGLKLSGWGVAIILVSLGANWAFSIKGESGSSRLSLELDTTDGPSALISGVAFWFGLALAVVGSATVLFDLRAMTKAANRNRVLVFEFRGLRDTADKPLLGAIPAKYVGQRIDCHIDVRQYLESDPPNVASAIAAANQIPTMLTLHRGSTLWSDVTVIAGGLAPVPLLFYTGMLLDDGGSKVHFDWERTKRQWQELSDADDGCRFKITGLETVGGGDQAVLAISSSYKVAAADIAECFGPVPLVTMEFADSALNKLWSEEKQAALVAQFLEVISRLSDKRITTVHMVLSVSASLGLRLGAAYDRNMPQAKVYQYEPKKSPKYPWSIAMPRSVGQPAELVPMQSRERQP
jgi:hypothetical protein